MHLHTINRTKQNKTKQKSLGDVKFQNEDVNFVVKTFRE